MRTLARKDNRGLVFLGDSDGTLDQKSVRTIYSKLYPNAKWIALPGAGHHLVNERPEIKVIMNKQIGLSGVFVLVVITARTVWNLYEQPK